MPCSYYSASRPSVRCGQQQEPESVRHGQHPYSFAPRGFVFCEGQELSVAQNAALFSLIGVNYGGDGRATFNLPDTRAAEAAAQKASRGSRPPFRYAIAAGTGAYPSRT